MAAVSDEKPDRSATANAKYDDRHDDDQRPAPHVCHAVKRHRVARVSSSSAAPC
jgi:hypothetical protein